MKTAYFDCSYGAAGDMILGALIDAGAPFEKIKDDLENRMKVEGIRLERTQITRAGVSATKVQVVVDNAEDMHRHLRHVIEIIENTDFPDRVKERAKKAYELIAVAEAKVHNSTPEKIHFHEVGCLDAIADVTGSMLAMEYLGIDRAAASPMATGTGTAKCAHGVIPVPAPATVEILGGVATRGTDFQMELCTPTGAAILRAVCGEAFGVQPPMRVGATGYGSGSREIEGHANFHRVLVGESEEQAERLPGGIHGRPLALLMTEVDDMSPEWLGDLMERLFEAGCLDAHFTSIQMKKNRPAVQVQVLCEPSDREKFLEILIRHSTSLGVKALEVQRYCVRRRKDTVETELGEAEVKVGFWDDQVLRVTPEYESCRKLAANASLPLSEVYAIVQEAVRNKDFTL
ncbi:MAG: nickel pincer cofactor biosynthesis protein LarC [Candidatus Sumerlaeota bacterium]